MDTHTHLEVTHTTPIMVCQDIASSISTTHGDMASELPPGESFGNEWHLAWEEDHDTPLTSLHLRSLRTWRQTWRPVVPPFMRP